MSIQVRFPEWLNPRLTPRQMKMDIHQGNQCGPSKGHSPAQAVSDGQNHSSCLPGPVQLSWECGATSAFILNCLVFLSVLLPALLFLFQALHFPILNEMYWGTSSVFHQMKQFGCQNHSPRFREASEEDADHTFSIWHWASLAFRLRHSTEELKTDVSHLVILWNFWSCSCCY